MTSARADAWTDFELQCLYDVVNDVDWFSRVSKLIDRSDNAIRAKMSALRAETGIEPGRAGPRARSRSRTAHDDARKGSDALLAAMIAVAPRAPAPVQPELPHEEVQLAMFDGPLFDWGPQLELAA
jgi:hypothetical protein